MTPLSIPDCCDSILAFLNLILDFSDSILDFSDSILDFLDSIFAFLTRYSTFHTQNSLLRLDRATTPLGILLEFAFWILYYCLIMKNIFDIGCRLGMIKNSHSIHPVKTSKDFVSFEAWRRVSTENLLKCLNVNATCIRLLSSDM